MRIGSLIEMESVQERMERIGAYEKIASFMQKEKEEEAEEEKDEHIWLSLVNAKLCSQEIAEAVSSKDETNDVCKNIINNYGIDLVILNTMETIDGGITNSNENYITIMNNNLDLLNKELYK